MTESGMRLEWGRAIRMRGRMEQHADFAESARRVLSRNYELARVNNPEIPEIEDWFLEGPVTEAFDYDLCPELHFDAVHPESCSACGGAGVVNARRVEGEFDHDFAWRARA